jgi:hypothetical protein
MKPCALLQQSAAYRDQHMVASLLVVDSLETCRTKREDRCAQLFKSVEYENWFCIMHNFQQQTSKDIL